MLHVDMEDVRCCLVKALLRKTQWDKNLDEGKRVQLDNILSDGTLPLMLTFVLQSRKIHHSMIVASLKPCKGKPSEKKPKRRKKSTTFHDTIELMLDALKCCLIKTFTRKTQWEKSS
jgi:hypothetical protein